MLDTNYLLVTCAIVAYAQFVVDLFLFSMITINEKCLINFTGLLKFWFIEMHLHHVID